MCVFVFLFFVHEILGKDANLIFNVSITGLIMQATDKQIRCG